MTNHIEVVQAFAKVAQIATPTPHDVSAALGTSLRMISDHPRHEWDARLAVGTPPVSMECSFICFPSRTLFWAKYTPRVPETAWAGLTGGLAMTRMYASPLRFVAPGVKGGELETTRRFVLRHGVEIGLVTGENDPSVSSAFVEWLIGCS